MTTNKKHSSEFAVTDLLLGITTLTFFVLKVTKVIDWAWVWVFAPIWISAVIIILMIAGFAITAAIISRKM